MEFSADDRQWSLESLEKAYQQGYMVGLTGQPRERQPYRAAVPAAAWEAGWDDGRAQYRLAQKSA
ncbi:ribosome modulation factor [Zestomonas thermotolerans]|jgi:ribosome modulation factor|uniref:ribosome modulation factor n=1 Tax=Zestomonas thermotolerans TaxID=157784 RepID=UPI00036729C6|nr:ribosome modulation factor [Pseudomonas thermotolerans]MBO2511045.1 hypothetical protein [Gammaproteobacteria bacterium]